MNQYNDWSLPYCANIVSLEDYPKEIKIFKNNNGLSDKHKVVCTSGGFDPIHPGHISCFFESRYHFYKRPNDAEILVVIVNGDDFLTRKKGKPFQDLKTRCQIVSAISAVDLVVPFEIENDSSVVEALKVIKPDYFTKGGDRKAPKDIPEWEICQKLGIEVIFGIGQDKLYGSSDFLNEWEKFKNG